MAYTSSNSWFYRIPPVTRNLILINLVIWLAEYLFPSLGERIVDIFGLHYISGIFSGGFNPAQIFTYMFVHDRHTIWHVAFNMFTLWMFGRVLENVWGARRYLFYYLVCGVGAALVQELVWALTLHHDFVDAICHMRVGLTPEYVEAELARNPEMYAGLLDQFKSTMVTVGASGAVFGLLLAFGFIFPDMPLYLMFIPVPIKAKYMVVGYGVIEFFLGVSGRMSTVAHFAHLGGMLFGLALLLYWRRRGSGPNRVNPFR
ncbi:MAG: rhomboid family intramembrane serine protease [Bacteroides sp.]|nr:rhomboid family intramembrane serine protease [Bacteroides sp.]